MANSVYYHQGNVRVTDSTLEVRDEIYRLSQIDSVDVAQARGSTGCGVWLMIAGGAGGILGLVMTVAALGDGVDGVAGAAGLAILGGLIFAVGFFGNREARGDRTRYSVQITTAAGSQDVMWSDEKAVSTAVVEAIRRGKESSGHKAGASEAQFESRDDRAMALRSEAIELEDSDPAKAVQIYLRIADEYPDTWTFHNLVLDDMTRLAEANGRWWEETIKAIEVGINHRPSDVHETRLRRARLKSEGKYFEALESEFENVVSRVDDANTYWGYGRQFAQLDDPRAHDRAWGLYNKAVGLSAKEGRSPHSIRRDMAAMLMDEDKPSNAVQMLILSISEAKMFGESWPKVLERELRKAMRADGINLRLSSYRELPKAIIEAAEKQGYEAAVALYQDWRKQGNDPSLPDERTE